MPAGSQTIGLPCDVKIGAKEFPRDELIDFDERIAVWVNFRQPKLKIKQSMGHVGIS